MPRICAMRATIRSARDRSLRVIARNELGFGHRPDEAISPGDSQEYPNGLRAKPGDKAGKVMMASVKSHPPAPFGFPTHHPARGTEARAERTERSSAYPSDANSYMTANRSLAQAPPGTGPPCAFARALAEGGRGMTLPKPTLLPHGFRRPFNAFRYVLPGCVFVCPLRNCFSIFWQGL